MRSGIAAGGNWIVDHVKTIDVYPSQDALATILSETNGNGGSAYNVLKNLAKLGYKGGLEAIGLISDDPAGNGIRGDCLDHGIKTELLALTTNASTSYTDVMAVQSTGRRTFFQHRGANAFLGEEHFDFSRINATHLHLGYLLLLDRLDELDQQFGTAATKILTRAKEEGMTTSFDVVSEDSDRFTSIVLPVLKVADIAFMNEFELERTAGNIGGSIETNGQKLSQICAGYLVIHTPERVFAYHREQATQSLGSVRLPNDQIVGQVGAGDAFAAGFLYGFVEKRPIGECLKLGVCAAASSLLAADCSSGVLPLDQCLALGDKYGFR